MPQGKGKKGRASGKKKNKGGQNQAPKSSAQASSNSTAHPAIPRPSRNVNPSDGLLDRVNFPQWGNSYGAGGEHPHFRPTVYSRYKEATKRFAQSLRRMVPSSIFQGDKVNSFMDAVDYLAEQSDQEDSVLIYKQLISDLKLSIRVRKRVALDMPGGGDEGHAYFILVLNYCLRVLQHLCRKQEKEQHEQLQEQAVSEPSDDDKDAVLSNKFSALFMDNDEDDDLFDSESEDQASEIKRPTPLAKPQMSIEDIVREDDRFDAVLFLITLDELMGLNVDEYQKLKSTWRRYRLEGCPPSAIAENLMKTAVSANFSFQLVSSLEQTLQSEHPHMNSYYRVMAVVTFRKLTMELAKIVSAHSPKSSAFQRGHAIEFLGDCLERAFRNPSDPKGNRNRLIDGFVKKWKVPENSIASLVDQIQMIAAIEIPKFSQTTGLPLLHAQIAALGLNKHSWLPNSRFIGRGRSISHTVCLLQKIGTVVSTMNGPLVTRPGYFEARWDENRRPATNIAEDLDELLMTEILPILLLMSSKCLLSSKLPYEPELLTFFVELKSFIKRPTASVSWSLAFAVHTMLTSVIEIQGDGDFEALAKTSKEVFNSYFRQIESAKMMSKEHVTHGKFWNENLKRTLALAWLTENPAAVYSEKQEMKALWNPLCAGSFVLYTAYFSNIDGGLAMVDSCAQLRVVLHLYNALLKVGVLQPNKLDLLDWLFKIFSNSKAVWEGQLPEKGSFVLRWWIAYGTAIPEAKRLTKNTRIKVQIGGGALSSKSNALSRDSYNIARNMSPIKPEDLSKSFRRICRRDFFDVVDKYHTEKQRRSSREVLPDLFEHTVRTTDTLDAMDMEQRILASNFMSLGAILNQFVENLFRVLDLVSLVDLLLEATPRTSWAQRRTDGRNVGTTSWEASEANMRRQTEVHVFLDRVMGPLDFSESVDQIPIVVKAAEFMETYFSQVNMDKVLYFFPYKD